MLILHSEPRSLLRDQRPERNAILRRDDVQISALQHPHGMTKPLGNLILGVLLLERVGGGSVPCGVLHACNLAAAHVIAEEETSNNTTPFS